MHEAGRQVDAGARAQRRGLAVDVERALALEHVDDLVVCVEVVGRAADGDVADELRHRAQPSSGVASSRNWRPAVAAPLASRVDVDDRVGRAVGRERVVDEDGAASRARPPRRPARGAAGDVAAVPGARSACSPPIVARPLPERTYSTSSSAVVRRSSDRRRSAARAARTGRNRAQSRRAAILPAELPTARSPAYLREPAESGYSRTPDSPLRQTGAPRGV